MTDPTDDLDVLAGRLRRLARDTESVIQLPGPADARWRARRRKVRRRTGIAAAAVTVLAILTPGSWHLMSGDDEAGMVVPAASDPPAPSQRRAAPPPPAALPRHEDFDWQMVTDSQVTELARLPTVLGPCDSIPDLAPADSQLELATSFVAGLGVARYELLDAGTAGRAAEVMAQLQASWRFCAGMPWPQDSMAVQRATEGTDVVLSVTQLEDAAALLYLVRDGSQLATLTVTGLDTLPLQSRDAVLPAPEREDVTANCLVDLLRYQREGAGAGRCPGP